MIVKNVCFSTRMDVFLRLFHFETSYMPRDLSYRKYVLVSIEALCSGYLEPKKLRASSKIKARTLLLVKVVDFHSNGCGGFVLRPSPQLFWLQVATTQGFNRYQGQMYERSIDFAKNARDRQTFIGRPDIFSWECKVKSFRSATSKLLSVSEALLLLLHFTFFSRTDTYFLHFS